MIIENNKHAFVIVMEQSSLFRLLIILESLWFKPDSGNLFDISKKTISQKFGKMKHNLIYVEMIKVLQYIFNLMQPSRRRF
jgi:hypothetical protein